MSTPPVPSASASAPSTAGPDLRGTFHLDTQPALSRSTVDRREQVRHDPGRVAASWARARLVRVDPSGRAPVRESDDGTARLVETAAGDTAAEVPDGAVLLGEEDGPDGVVPYWALRVEDPDAANDAGSGFSAHELWRDLRTVGGDLDARGAGLLTTAVSLLNWHDRAGFCARDGSPTRAVKAGWARVCEGHGHEEYPRTDPSMICLVHDGADRVLLARQPIWPAGRYSVLAGFVEAGESLEACVARECAEEVGVTVTAVTYLGSQPWPFPRSLMIGFAAVADPDEPFALQEGEIEHARWITRAELREALARGGWSSRESPGDGADADLVLPGGVSIARSMLEAWAAAGAGGAG